MIDFGVLVVGPLMGVFGEDPSAAPMYQRRNGGVAVGAPFALQPVFDDAYKALVMQADGDPEIATLSPVMGVAEAQFAGVPGKQGDSVTVPRIGKSFLVSDYQPDGHGHVKLVLEEAA